MSLSRASSYHHHHHHHHHHLLLLQYQFFVFVLTLTMLLWLPLSMAFTVIMSDSGVPSTLVDAPQTGFSMTHDRARTDKHEQEAVYEIMKATGNAWATSIPDVCRGRWHGIECMPDKDEVYHIVALSFGALSDDTAFPTCDQTTSYISPALTRLPHIRTLFFYQCFTLNPQPIPTFLGQLGPSLHSLVLRDNGHVGPIPSQLGNLTLLRVLDLHSNNLTSSIPHSLVGLTRLRSLDLSSNQLTGRIPPLPTEALNVLDLSQNLLQGPIPSGLLGYVPSLVKMDLSRNRLTGPIPDSLMGLKSLMLLDLSYNRLSGPLPISISNLVSLQALILKVNPMDSTTICGEVFAPLKNLMILVLSNMGLEGPLPESLAQLSSLRVLHLDGNQFNGSIPRSFKNMANLSELRVNDNSLVGSIPFDREMVWRMGRKLRLSNNRGLCYDPRRSNGQEQGADDSMLGIGACDMEMVPGTTTTTEHFSTVDHQWPGVIGPSISGSSKSPTDVLLLSKIILVMVLIL